MYKQEMVIAQIRMRIGMAKEAFNIKISLLTSKLDIELRRNWLAVMFGILLFMAQRPGP